MALRVAAASATAFARCCHRFKGATMKATVIPALAAVVILASAVGFAQTAPPPGPRADTAFVSVQPQGQWLASRFVGQAVSNQAGQNVGDINDLLFDKTGRMSTAVIGVGGFLGMGEKSVAIPFGSLAFTADAAGKRVVTIPLSKEQLQAAPSFEPTERTAYMRAKEQASEMGHKAIDKASELKDMAGKKIEDMRGGPTPK
jgi:sporulation protein YlmC with PRC-barrel domain